MKTTEKIAALDLQGSLEKGKRIASALVILSAFVQSIYASYIKTEDEHIAKENYSIQSKALESFSEDVDVKVAELNGRLAVLEKVCLDHVSNHNEVKVKSRRAKPEPETMGPPEPPAGHNQLYKSLKVHLPQDPWGEE